jgi:hypothetical protein
MFSMSDMSTSKGRDKNIIDFYHELSYVTKNYENKNDNLLSVQVSHHIKNDEIQS